MAYIALKPVRFKRQYAISEIIPEAEVNPAMAKKLIEWGKIAKVGENAPVSPENAPNSDETDAGDKLPADEENGSQGENEAPTDDAGGEANESTDPADDDAGGDTRKRNHKK